MTASSCPQWGAVVARFDALRSHRADVVVAQVAGADRPEVEVWAHSDAASTRLTLSPEGALTLAAALAALTRVDEVHRFARALAEAARITEEEAS